jgi:hypothetical protein
MTMTGGALAPLLAISPDKDTSLAPADDDPDMAMRPPRADASPPNPDSCTGPTAKIRHALRALASENGPGEGLNQVRLLNRTPARPGRPARTGCASVARSLSISRPQYRRCDRIRTAIAGKPPGQSPNRSDDPKDDATAAACVTRCNRFPRTGNNAVADRA